MAFLAPALPGSAAGCRGGPPLVDSPQAAIAKSRTPPSLGRSAQRRRALSAAVSERRFFGVEPTGWSELFRSQPVLFEIFCRSSRPGESVGDADHPAGGSTGDKTGSGRPKPQVGPPPQSLLSSIAEDTVGSSTRSGASKPSGSSSNLPGGSAPARSAPSAGAESAAAAKTATPAPSAKSPSGGSSPSSGSQSTAAAPARAQSSTPAAAPSTPPASAAVAPASATPSTSTAPPVSGRDAPTSTASAPTASTAPPAAAQTTTTSTAASSAASSKPDLSATDLLVRGLKGLNKSSKAEGEVVRTNLQTTWTPPSGDDESSMARRGSVGSLSSEELDARGRANIDELLPERYRRKQDAAQATGLVASLQRLAGFVARAAAALAVAVLIWAGGRQASLLSSLPKAPENGAVTASAAPPAAGDEAPAAPAGVAGDADAAGSAAEGGAQAAAAPAQQPQAQAQQQPKRMPIFARLIASLDGKRAKGSPDAPAVATAAASAPAAITAEASGVAGSPAAAPAAGSAAAGAQQRPQRVPRLLSMILARLMEHKGTQTDGVWDGDSARAERDQAVGTAKRTQVLGHHAMEEAPAADLLVLKSSRGRQVKLRSAAARAFDAMVAAARADGVDIYPVSGFRSVNDQVRVFFDIKASRSQAAHERAKVSAPPGYSEHHTGYAIDVGDGKRPDTILQENFETTAAYRWLCANAARFHFEISFPRDNAQGIMYEPWHWRFIGDIHSLETFAPSRQPGK